MRPWLQGVKLKKNKSFLYLGFFFILVVASFFIIKNGPKIQGAPTTLRYGFMLNEKVWSILQSSKRLSVAKPLPIAGKKPRVNGLIGLKSEINLKTYLVEVTDGSHSINLSMTDFQLLPKSDYTTDFRCIEGWSEETQYAGVRFSDFMNSYNLGKKANGSYYAFVGLETPDKKYYVSIDMESMLHPQTVLAYEMNLRPLSLDNGAPLRLVIPIKYGIKSLKRIGKITFSDSRPPDYWAERGYDWYSGL